MRSIRVRRQITNANGDNATSQYAFNTKTGIRVINFINSNCLSTIFVQIFPSCFEYFDPCHVRSVLAINLFSNYIFILVKYIDSYIRCFFAISNNFKYFLKIDE